MGRLLAAGTFIAGAVVFASTARAWTLGGFAGSSELRVDTGCFAEIWGMVKQSGCSGSFPWVVHLPVNASGGHGATVWIQQSTANQVICGSVGQSSNGDDGPVYWSGNVGTASTGTVSIGLGSVSVPGGGYFYAYCYLPQNTGVYSVNWSDGS
jgi:hypothetical protein